MFDISIYCLEGETWKDIPDYKGIYQASNLGRIRSIDGKQTHSVIHGIRTWKGKVLKNKTRIPRKEGYRVTLWKDKTPKDFLVARLVCMTFYGKPNDFNDKTRSQKMTVNHKDGNRLNNDIKNMEWLTLKENVKHAFDNDLMPTCSEVYLINKEMKAFKFRSFSKASEFLGKSHGYVSGQIKRKQNMRDAKGNEFIACKSF